MQIAYSLLRTYIRQYLNVYTHVPLQLFAIYIGKRGVDQI